MSRPASTTIVFGLFGAVVLFVWMGLPMDSWGWPGLKPVLCLMTALYAILLARWSRTRMIAILFPVGLLLGAAVGPWGGAGVYLLALGILSWVRSGICFSAPPVRLLAAEIICTAGGAALAAVWEPQSPLAWALSLWLFFAAQALYFSLLPGAALPFESEKELDAFETALKEAQEIVG